MWVRVKFGYKRTDDTANEGGKQVSSEDRSVGHDDCGSGCESTTFGCDLFANWVTNERTDDTANGVKSKSGSIEDRSVGHNDRRRG